MATYQGDLRLLMSFNPACKAGALTESEYSPHREVNIAFPLQGTPLVLIEQD
jgi:hypothetical protein